MVDKNYIWIFGENHGSTANNNSYFFWKHVVNFRDEIDKYIVFEKNENTQKVYESLSDYEKQFVLWKNSKKHFKLYHDADLFFITLSYKDILPNKILFKNLNLKINKPVIYLRHGTAGMKRTDYHGRSYWNNMFKFLSFNSDEIDDLINYNNFERHQIYSADFLPRYCEFVRKDREITDKNQILWFITWREYLGSNIETSIFIDNIINVLKSEDLQMFLKKKNIILKLCVHQFFDRKNFADIYKYSKKGLIEIVHSKDVDVMDELVKSNVLITDYSSVAYDFSFLNRPVLLYQPDLDTYNSFREFMCDIEEMKKYNLITPEELINAIINEQFEINPFFRENWPENIDYDYIEEGRHIHKMYEYFSRLQKNKVTVLGLNFYENTEIVNTVMSLVEELLNNDYFVEVISLYRQINRFKSPNGLPARYLYWKDTLSKKEKLSRKRHFLKGTYGNLKYDDEIDYFHPSIAHNLNDLIKNIKSHTIISTRESLHLYLDKCTSSKVLNKIYFLTTPLDYTDKNYDTLINKIKDINIDKSIFSSQRDIDFYENNLNLKIPSSKLIYNASIVENQIVTIDLDSDFFDENNNLKEWDSNLWDDDLWEEYKLLNSIKIDKKEDYIGLCLVSFSKYYIDELNNIIEFGKYLKKNNIENITIDVIGKGNYSMRFIELIYENDLFNYINFLGNNLNIIGEIRRHDFILNLSQNPNHDIYYLQGVLNYKKVFCFKNKRSQEIFKDIPDSFIESYDWLCNQINNIYKLSFEDFDDYANCVKDNYLNKITSKKLIDFIED